MSRLLPSGLAVLLCLALAGPGLPEEEDVDGALIARVGAHLDPRGKLPALGKALGAEPEERRDLGFDGAWARFELYGDAVGLYVDVVTWREWVAAIRVHSFELELDVQRRIRRAWGERARFVNDRLEVRGEKANEMKRLRRAVWKALRGPRRADLALPGRSEGKTLADPLAELTYGTLCYVDGSPPQARALATALWKNGSQDALDAVLSGPNPEGRVYAAEMLLRLAIEGDAIGGDRRERIRKVLALDVPIRSCAGCEVFDQKAATALSEPALRKDVLCRVHVRHVHMGQAYTEVRVVVHGIGLRMAQRHPAPGVLACIPIIDRDVVPDVLLRRLHEAVEGGEGLEMRDGLPTFRIEPGKVAQAPKVVRDLLATLPKAVWR